MLKNALILLTLVATSYLAGCATVPMSSVEQDNERKEFTLPSQDTAGLYIYRNSNLGGALKKTIYIDGVMIGETAPMTYFYKAIKPGIHELSTESEFSNNSLELDAKGGQNHFVRQYIKLGVFVGGANFELVSEKEGKEGVLECKLAK
ncbi:DUF2846 domain-containing protein [Gammaproteobacteria bacterium]|nr:DUF2846 domain-containing protein [Gammaproteobacteria bacterium]